MPTIQSVRDQALVQQRSMIFSFRLLRKAEKVITLPEPTYHTVLQVTKSVLSAVVEGLRSGVRVRFCC